MHKTTRYALITGALFFLVLALSVGKPGLPVTLKADEPAYFLMALSLAHDGDLECGPDDFHRAIDSYPYLPTENLILMTESDGGSVSFGKPLIYPLLAAPFAAIFGANGLVALNVALLVLMIAMGSLYLARFNPDGQAALFSTAFFVLSPAFTYVFWLQPEILNMASATGCLFFALHRFEGNVGGTWWRRLGRRAFNASTAPWWSAAALAAGTYNKPVLALIGIPAMFAFWRRQEKRRFFGWLLAAVVAMAIIAGISLLLTGHPTPYLGVVRTGVTIEDPAAMGPIVSQAFERVVTRSPTGNAWSWIFRVPSVDVRELAENIGYFLWGRHTGLLLYFPFAIASCVLFLIHQRRSPERWLLLAATAAVAAFFLLFIPFNWHGGGGFVGNRYFVMAYPAFLFLVTSLKPLWVLPAASVLAGTFLGTILLTPFGAPVAEPTLQAHVRGGLFRYFPLELSVRLTVPGYRQMGQAGVLFIGRKDVFRTHKPDRGYVWLDAASRGKIKLAGSLDHSAAWIYGATESEILVLTEDPIDSLLFEVASWAGGNTVRFELGGTVEEITFPQPLEPGDWRQVVELQPGRHARVHRSRGKRFLVYRLLIEPLTGKRVVARQNPTQQFFLGAQIRYLGRRNQVTRPENFRIKWPVVEAPASVAAGSEITIPVTIRNVSAGPLGSDEPLAVFASYHWYDETGKAVLYDGMRSAIRPSVPPDKRRELELTVRAPEEPGRYRLVLDAVRENIAWFSELGGATREIEVEVEVAGTSEPH